MKGNKRGIVLISVDYPADPKFSQVELAKQMQDIINVKGVYVVTGTSDIIVLLAAEDMITMSESVMKIRSMPCVKRTETAMVLNAIKTDWFGLQRRESAEAT